MERPLRRSTVSRTTGGRPLLSPASTFRSSLTVRHAPEPSEPGLPIDPQLPAGRVLAVSPEPGKKLSRGQSVDVTVSSGKVTIPELIGQPLDVAMKLVESIASVTPVASEACPIETGYPVIEQSLVGQQPQGSQLSLTYCSG